MEKGDCFAINHGKYIGKFIVCVEKYISGECRCLMMPGKFKILTLSEESIQKALEQVELDEISSIKLYSMIEFVEHLPDNVFQVINEQYKLVKQDKKAFIDDLFAPRN